MGGEYLLFLNACEHEDEDGKVCDKPAGWRSLFFWNLAEKRFGWLCRQHYQEVEVHARKLEAEVE